MLKKELPDKRRSVSEVRRLLLPLTASSSGPSSMAKVMSNEEEEDLAGDLLEGAATRDSRRTAAKGRYEAQVQRYLNEAVATTVADLYLTQAEINVHYFHIGNALQTVEKRRAAMHLDDTLGPGIRELDAGESLSWLKAYLYGESLGLKG